MNMRRLLAVLGVILTVALISGCASKKVAEETAPAPETAQKAGPVTFDEAVANAYEPQMCPCVDGGAYLITDQGVWYIQGSRAVRVKEGNAEGKAAPKSSSLAPREKQLWVMLQTKSSELRHEQDTVSDSEMDQARDKLAGEAADESQEHW